MLNKPYPLTKQFIIENAEYTLGPSSHHWKAWVWESIVLLSVSGTWPAEKYSHYFSEFWDIFCERKKSWDKVYFVFDANNMPIQSEEFRDVQKTGLIFWSGKTSVYASSSLRL